MSSEEIKQRKDKDPDQIDEMPEQAAHFDAVSQMFGIPLIELLADRQPHVKEDQHASENVQTV
jgi:hypothetical protein